MEIKKFECNRDRFTIRGTLYRPERDNLPIAIVSHAFLCDQRSTRHYARALAEMGYAAFCFDFVGGSARSRSSGRLRDMTIFTEIEDLKTVIRFAQEQSCTDESRVTLMGCSQGAFVSALTAVEMQETVENLILFYPALCIPEDARKGQMLFFSFDPKNIPPLIKAKGKLLRLGRDYAASVMDMDAYAAIRNYKGSVFLVFGSEDEVVPAECFAEAEKVYRESGADIDSRCIYGAKHGFTPEEDVTALDAVTRFLAE